MVEALLYSDLTQKERWKEMKLEELIFKMTDVKNNTEYKLKGSHSSNFSRHIGAVAKPVELATTNT